MDGPSAVEELAGKPKFDSLEERMTRTYGQIGLVDPDGTVKYVREYAAGLNISEDHPHYADIRMALEQTAEFTRMFGVLSILRRSGRLELDNEDDNTLKRQEPGGNVMVKVPPKLFHEYVREIERMPDKKIRVDTSAFAGVFADQLKKYNLVDVAEKVLKQANLDSVPLSKNGSASV